MLVALSVHWAAQPGKSEDWPEANNEPAHPACVDPEFTSMRARSIALKWIQWGFRPRGSTGDSRRRAALVTTVMCATIACAVDARDAIASPPDRDAKIDARAAADLAEARAGVRSIVAAVDSRSDGVAPRDLRLAMRRRVPAMGRRVRVSDLAADPSLDPVPPIAPDPAPRRGAIRVGPDHLPPTWDLDGTYLWLGPVGAASHIDGQWDSTFGAEAAVIVVREQEALAAFGASMGASRWTARGGGRIWLDGVAGTRVFGRMLGASLGPIAELSELAHPRLGASVGVWGFAGITPFARAGAVSDLGMFLEIGIHIALPALRR